MILFYFKRNNFFLRNIERQEEDSQKKFEEPNFLKIAKNPTNISVKNINKLSLPISQPSKNNDRYQNGKQTLLEDIQKNDFFAEKNTKPVVKAQSTNSAKLVSLKFFY